MALTEEIKIVVKAITSQASKDMKALGDQVKAAETPAKKVGAAFKGAAKLIEDNWQLVGTSVGAAIGLSIKAFQDLALESGNLADATGLSVDQASRWVEVADDVGVSAETLQGSFGKMAKAIGANPQAFADLGVEIAHAKDGTVDLNGTILNAIGTLNATKDATERAKLGAALFGKGWQSLAPIIAQGSDQIAASLAQVSGAKVITEDELARAREFRATLDRLTDQVDDLKLTLGQAVIEGVQPTLQALGELTQHADDLAQHFGGLGGVFKNLISNLPGVGSLGPLNAALDSNRGAWDRVKGGIGALVPVLQHVPFLAVSDGATKATKAQKEHAEQSAKVTAAVAEETKAEEAANAERDQAIKLLDEMNKAQRTLADVTEDVAKGQIEVAASIKEANAAGGKQLDLNFKALDTTKALADDLVKQAQAQAEAKGQTLDATHSQAVWNNSMLTSAATAKGPLQASILAYIGTVNGIPPEKVTEIQADLARGDLAAAEAALNTAARDRQSTIHADADLSAWQRAWDQAILQARAQGQNLRQMIVGFMAGGTVGPKGALAMVGEAGRELVALPGGAKVIPHAQTERALAGGGQGSTVVNIEVTVSGTAQPADVGRGIVSAIRAYERSNGRKVLAS